MNTWSLEKLKNIINIKEVKTNITSFDHLRITAIANKKYERKAKNILFFPITLGDDVVRDGWIIRPLDLRKNIINYIKDKPDYTYVIDDEMKKELKEVEFKYIVVDDIMTSIDKLFTYTLEGAKAKKICVTGSVGKTTTAGLIEDVLKTKYKVLRLYSKRLTPIIIKAYIINLLTINTDYIVLEASIWYRDHVKKICDLLKPDICALINIDSSHLNNDGMNTKDDLCKYKALIFEHPTIGFVNENDNYISNLHISDNHLYYNNDKICRTNVKEFISIMENVSYKGDKILINDRQIKPFVLSKLSLVEYALAYKIGMYLGIDNETITLALNNAGPVEHRLEPQNIFGKDVIFDSDISTYERIKQLAGNLYDKSYLVIRKFGSAEHTNRMVKVRELFDEFDRVYLFSDIAYLKYFKDHKNVTIVSNHDFMKKIDGTIFYHYSGYYRSFDKFNVENLKYIENKRYKVLERRD